MSCLLAILSSIFPFCPFNLRCNSLLQRNLPATPLLTRIYAEIPAIPMKTRNFGGGGEGGTPEPSHPKLGKNAECLFATIACCLCVPASSVPVAARP